MEFLEGTVEPIRPVCLLGPAENGKSKRRELSGLEEDQRYEERQSTPWSKNYISAKPILDSSEMENLLAKAKLAHEKRYPLSLRKKIGQLHRQWECQQQNEDGVGNKA